MTPEDVKEFYDDAIIHQFTIRNLLQKAKEQNEKSTIAHLELQLKESIAHCQYLDSKRELNIEAA